MIPQDFIIQDGHSWSMIPIFESDDTLDDYIVGWKLRFISCGKEITTSSIIQAHIQDNGSAIFKIKGGKFYKINSIDANFNKTIWNHSELCLKKIFFDNELIAYAKVDDLIKLRNSTQENQSDSLTANLIDYIEPVRYNVINYTESQQEKEDEERINRSIFS